jgi:hypothetical protein
MKRALRAENAPQALLHSSSTIPPPWTLTGSAAVLLSRRGAVMLVHYETSPVGSYNEWALAVLTTRGPRVVDMAVTSEASCRGGRENWGFPKRLANLQWRQRGARIEFRGESEIYRLRAFGPCFALCVRAWCVQMLGGRDVRVPFLLRGDARLAWRGRQLALLVEDFEFIVDAPEVI